jgi:hypothetical protein
MESQRQHVSLPKDILGENAAPFYSFSIFWHSLGQKNGKASTFLLLVIVLFLLTDSGKPMRA